jgi:putative ATPase
MIGPPECWLHLAHVTAYLARAPKSWAAYQGLGAARALVAQRPHYPVPAHLRNATTSLDRRLGHGDGYVHASQPGGDEVEFLPPELKGESIYRPSGNGQDR